MVDIPAWRAPGDPTITFSDSANFDAFSRLRISPPNVIFDSTLEYGIPEDWVQTVTGAATITYLPNERSANLTVASGETARTRTKHHFRYTPGQSMLFFMTGVMGQSANTTRSIGYFDDENGLGFRHNGTTAGNITLRGTGAGTAYCRIRAGGNASNQALYSVPRRKEASVEGWTISSVVDDKSVFGKIALRANVDWKNRDTLIDVFLYQKELVIAETTGHFIFAPHLVFPPMCDIKISAEKLAGGVKNLVATGNFTVVTRYL